MVRPITYLFVLLLPVTVWISFTSSGWITFLPLLVFFGVVPIIELFFKPIKENLTKEQETSAKNNKFYTYILYLVGGVHIAFIMYFLTIIGHDMSTLDRIGKITAMGLMCGVTGINVAHELGHRNTKLDTFFAEVLLLTSLNTHFLPYHNGGHHLNVATPDDAATARRNESLYVFWFRSHFMSYVEAWQLENRRSGHWFSLKNKMLMYTMANIAVLTLIYLFFGFNALLGFVLAAIMGILLLESVNYIEHYGLLREKKNEKRFEKVKRIHSWNSDHIFGKLMLFNLSRHSDHHYNGSKHYQLLKSLPESPQMPTGYPGMIIISFLPFLWFKLMNKKIEKLTL